MNIEFTSRHFDASEEIRQHAIKKLAKINKLVERPIGCHVIFVSENSECRTEIRLSVPGKKLIVKESSDDMFRSIDGAVEKLIGRIVKFKGKKYAHI